jgi:gamma-glutamyl-gamma-aminobutyraldehyde dehydrogenase
VLEDAEDLDLVAGHIVNGAFWNMGENCSASSRLIVHEAVKDELMKHIIARTRDWKTGDPLNPAHHLGALVDKEHFRKVSSYLKRGKALVGGKTSHGCYVLPTIFDGVKPGDRLAQEEIFGPVLAVITVRSTDEAIAVANQTDYGLAASLFSANGKQALRAAREIRAGTVTINCYGEGDITTPFGGYKQSGFGGRDNSLHAHDQYTELKTIWIDLSDRDRADRVG